ncbi:hypothetical protein [Desulfovibrio ferrophilus]|uniref:Histone deacetylase complex subunit SAP18 n=1 Tax=Desulfovibrio ferrophilus TaxID=241368 RepID=A0A2Z6B3B8_9BACT|nr:hypothetical protein [Desulfovibrio ferrophilus]BBD10009.1 histone deacetylase complex subunit SAP18 [Desulfovibrio ferrophilus]
MTIELRKDHNHLVCSWEEPANAVFQGKQVTIRRKLMRRLKLTTSGQIGAAELSKLGSSKRTNAVRTELNRLRRSGAFSG